MVDFTWHQIHFHLSNAIALLALGGMVGRRSGRALLHACPAGSPRGALPCAPAVQVLAAVVMVKQFTAQKKQRAQMFATLKKEPARFMGQPGTQASRW